jgi:hypothetical protein
MAEDDKRPESQYDGPPDQRLQQMLENRWDPGKLSKFMRGSSSKSQKLDMSQRGRFEKRLGVDLGDVRIFTGELAEEITRAHGAEALTVGDTGMILMRNSGAFTPGSAAGTALLAHELTHVAQAKPSSISFKKTQRTLAEEDESEAEAEEVEEETRAEETGGAPQKESQADKDSKSRDRKEAIYKRVLEMFEEDVFLNTLRMGMARTETR